jgi:acetoin utilization protein AcuB
MFQIQGLDGIQFNIPLEDLKHNEKISNIQKSNVARKLIDNEEEHPANETSMHAVKAYKEAIKINNEREPILHAYSIMKSPVLTLDPEMRIAEAWKYLKENSVGHMPVLSNEKKIIGILSDRDLLKCLCIIDYDANNTASKKVLDVMTKKVITSDKLTDIRRIAKAMFENHIGSMLVVEESGDLAGIITRSDILYALINYPPMSLWI